MDATPRWIRRTGGAAGTRSARAGAGWEVRVGTAGVLVGAAAMAFLAEAARGDVPAWALMWGIAAALFAAGKAATLLPLRRSGTLRLDGRLAAYLFAWPGMDPRGFLDLGRRAQVPTRREWLAAAGKTALGAGLLWGIARQAPAGAPTVAAWIGMVGLILAGHCGAFHLLSLAWRRAGVWAPPIMDAPPLATSLEEFWGRRWNRAFRDIVHPMVFRPLLRRTGPAWASLAVFGFSGLVHELVISVPAGAGYGLPLAYFSGQGIGVLLERSTPGRKLGLGRGWRGWLFAMVMVAGPLFWLFHPAFVHTVAIPFFKAVGAR